MLYFLVGTPHSLAPLKKKVKKLLIIAQVV